jgi:hypothetical protein
MGNNSSSEGQTKFDAIFGNSTKPETEKNLHNCYSANSNGQLNNISVYNECPSGYVTNENNVNKVMCYSINSNNQLNSPQQYYGNSCPPNFYDSENLPSITCYNANPDFTLHADKYYENCPQNTVADENDIKIKCYNANSDGTLKSNIYYGNYCPPNTVSDENTIKKICYKANLNGTLNTQTYYGTNCPLGTSNNEQNIKVKCYKGNTDGSLNTTTYYSTCPENTVTDENTIKKICYKANLDGTLNTKTYYGKTCPENTVSNKNNIPTEICYKPNKNYSLNTEQYYGKTCPPGTVNDENKIKKTCYNATPNNTLNSSTYYGSCPQNTFYNENNIPQEICYKANYNYTLNTQKIYGTIKCPQGTVNNKKNIIPQVTCYQPNTDGKLNSTTFYNKPSCGRLYYSSISSVPTQTCYKGNSDGTLNTQNYYGNNCPNSTYSNIKDIPQKTCYNANNDYSLNKQQYYINNCPNGTYTSSEYIPQETCYNANDDYSLNKQQYYGTTSCPSNTVNNISSLPETTCYNPTNNYGLNKQQYYGTTSCPYNTWAYSDNIDPQITCYKANNNGSLNTEQYYGTTTCPSGTFSDTEEVPKITCYSEDSNNDLNTTQYYGNNCKNNTKARIDELTKCYKATPDGSLITKYYNNKTCPKNTNSNLNKLNPKNCYKVNDTHTTCGESKLFYDIGCPNNKNYYDKCTRKFCYQINTDRTKVIKNTYYNLNDCPTGQFSNSNNIPKTICKIPIINNSINITSPNCGDVTYYGSNTCPINSNQYAKTCDELKKRCLFTNLDGNNMDGTLFNYTDRYGVCPDNTYVNKKDIPNYIYNKYSKISKNQINNNINSYNSTIIKCANDCNNDPNCNSFVYDGQSCSLQNINSETVISYNEQNDNLYFKNNYINDNRYSSKLFLYRLVLDSSKKFYNYKISQYNSNDNEVPQNTLFYTTDNISILTLDTSSKNNLNASSDISTTTSYYIKSDDVSIYRLILDPTSRFYNYKISPNTNTLSIPPILYTTTNNKSYDSIYTIDEKKINVNYYKDIKYVPMYDLAINPIYSSKNVYKYEIVAKYDTDYEFPLYYTTDRININLINTLSDINPKVKDYFKKDTDVPVLKNIPTIYPNLPFKPDDPVYYQNIERLLPFIDPNLYINEDEKKYIKNLPSVNDPSSVNNFLLYSKLGTLGLFILSPTIIGGIIQIIGTGIFIGLAQIPGFNNVLNTLNIIFGDGCKSFNCNDKGKEFKPAILLPGSILGGDNADCTKSISTSLYNCRGNVCGGASRDNILEFIYDSGVIQYRHRYKIWNDTDYTFFKINATCLIMQLDGNLVACDNNANIIWQSYTSQTNNSVDINHSKWGKICIVINCDGSCNMIDFTNNKVLYSFVNNKNPLKAMC